MIRCNLSDVMVLDQQKAEDFYVGKLGFVKKHDVPAGGARWLTVQAADGSGVELLLEPAGMDFAREYQKALYDRGIPFTQLGCDDVQAEYERLTKLGVTFRSEPAAPAPGLPVMATFEDGCGNLILLVEG
ncbi:VOC family protein [Mesorhizobium microcysteis]|uniref:VOC family protein n=1 Tax=Neoaquamicrobium microcysteis TaxID=2682781 RepID=A0A5D4GP48_9HYPH|nr:VOC family protein [Mesorhizobium microcysteis]TYR29792.1 VOC family protein [Mesorhizobium microcysteis]